MARNEVVNRGLFRDGSPRETWEIAEAGRRALKR
jgi:hypothetical protein